MNSTTLSPEPINHHHHHHHPIGPLPSFPESPPIPTRPTRPTVVVKPTLRPTIQQGQTNGTGQGLGLPAILFISIGSVVILIVLLVCIYMTWRGSKTRKRGWSWKQESKVGRAIQRASFFPRFSRYRNQPIVVNYPDPDSHLPNYSIQTPYTFSSSSTLASTPGSFQMLESRNVNPIPDVPSYRATIY